MHIIDLYDKLNQNYCPYPKDSAVHVEFESIVLKLKNKAACVNEKETISYQMLNDRANQLAWYISSLNIKTDTQHQIISFYLPQGIDAIITMLAILKSGRVYLPLSLDYPEERLAYMLNDSGAKIIITLNAYQESIQKLQLADVKIIYLDDVNVIMELKKFEKRNLKHITSSSDLAYIIYTSGSTGNPKGVAVTHKNILARFGPISFFNFRADDNLFQVGNLAFDAATFEIWGALLNKGTLIIVQKETLLTPEKFQSYINTSKNNVIFMTTALFNHYIDHAINTLSYFCCILFGGEKVNRSKIAKAKKLLTKTMLIHVYGPTETTTFSTFYPVNEHMYSYYDHVPIGRPLNNTSIYILDQDAKLCSINKTGELHIGGEGVSQGYLNNPKLCKEKFIENPFFTGKEGYDNQQLYKTGDLTYLLPDGNIEYVGRIDHQVKIRGLRIELNEIENELNKLTNIKQAIVDIHTKDEKKYLVAFIIPLSSLRTHEEKIKIIHSWSDELLERLPTYMIPSEFHFITYFPLTPNRKVDRSKLPKEIGVRIKHRYVSPKTNLQKKLAVIWKEILSLSKVGIYDDFFEIGGDSLTGMSVIAKANEANIDIQFNHLSKYKTIGSISKNIGKNLVTKHIKPKIETGVDNRFNLLPSQNELFIRGVKNINHFTMGVILKSVTLNISNVKSTLKYLTELHPALRLRFTQQEDGRWKQYYSTEDESYDIPIHVIDIKKIKNKDIEHYLFKENTLYHGSLSLVNGPVCHFLIYKGFSDACDRITFIIHHLVGDGYSMVVLFQDFERIYLKLNNLRTILVVNPTVDFKDWADCMTSKETNLKLKNQLDYWNQFDHTTTHYFLADHRCRNVKGKFFKTYSRILYNEPNIKIILNDISRTFNMNINQFLLSILALVYKEFSNDDIMYIEYVHNGRHSILCPINISRIVGFFAQHIGIGLKLNKLDLSDIDSLIKSLKNLSNQFNNIPDNGLGIALLKYIEDFNTKNFKPIRNFTTLFNYLDKYSMVRKDSKLFIQDNLPSGLEYDPNEQAEYLLSITMYLNNGNLCANTEYISKAYEDETIKNIFKRYEYWVRYIINYFK